MAPKSRHLEEPVEYQPDVRGPSLTISQDGTVIGTTLGEPPRRKGRPVVGRLPKDCTVPVKMSRDGVDAIDGRRGVWTRSEYVRQALMLAIKHNLRGPGA